METNKVPPFIYTGEQLGLDSKQETEMFGKRAYCDFRPSVPRNTSDGKKIRSASDQIENHCKGEHPGQEARMIFP